MTSIRKARLQDAEAVWQLRIDAINGLCRGHYSDAAMDRWTEGQCTQAFAEEVDTAFYLLELAGQPVACGAVIEGQVEGLFVSPQYGGLGLGKRMLKHLEAAARQQGLTKLTLESTLNAAPFYRSQGYQGERIAHYQSPRGFTLDCIPMEKLLLSPS
ncbi:GNAT family N-acetyltransferase [Ferrimonas futtsuensis]|uniref:GNAT family N-acetyltransferase n=1 Tax=Ferrimonas futtsuensis TaxID=364764 RepID=UPI000406FDFE|nr:GNAT family N-acetyltransferase [Ferrimonas futtsuensis]